MEKGEVIPETRKKADIGKRLIAAIIDLAIAVVLGLIPLVGGLIGAAYMLLRDGFNYEIMDRRSIGKKLMKLRPVTLDGKEVDLNISIKRNWMFAIGAFTSILLFIPIFGWMLLPIVGLISLIIIIIEFVLIITDAQGRRWGDRLANTIVIEVEE